jgi:hypothetical protein
VVVVGNSVVEGGGEELILVLVKILNLIFTLYTRYTTDINQLYVNDT